MFPSERACALQPQPKYRHPYDRTGHRLFATKAPRNRDEDYLR
jgi:hypothetical protein